MFNKKYSEIISIFDRMKVENILLWTLFTQNIPKYVQYLPVPYTYYSWKFLLEKFCK